MWNAALGINFDDALNHSLTTKGTAPFITLVRALALLHLSNHPVLWLNVSSR